MFRWSFAFAAVALGGRTASATSWGQVLDDVNSPRHAPVLFDDEPAAPVPVSRGQQPFPMEKDVDESPSQINSTQLNQLFQFENTPDICGAGEGYVTGNFEYTKYPGSTKTYRYALQGQYGLTDQIAIGGFVPVQTTKTFRTKTGVGDIGIYGQYKLDRIINPEIVDVSIQADFVLPTGNRSQLRDTGHFGFRPMVLAYKDFGMQGPGRLGVYGLAGFTITTNSDVRLGLAATYQYHELVGVLEFTDQTGDKFGKPLVQVTPGLIYRGFHPFEIGIGVPVGVNSGTPDWGINFKLTYAFR